MVIVVVVFGFGDGLIEALVVAVGVDKDDDVAFVDALVFSSEDCVVKVIVGALMVVVRVMLVGTLPLDVVGISDWILVVIVGPVLSV